MRRNLKKKLTSEPLDARLVWFLEYIFHSYDESDDENELTDLVSEHLCATFCTKFIDPEHFTYEYWFIVDGKETTHANNIADAVTKAVMQLR